MSLGLATCDRQDLQLINDTLDPSTEKLRADLQSCFGVDFSLWDGHTGELLRSGGDQPRGDEDLLPAIVQTVAGKNSPQFVGYEDYAVQLAIPFQWDQREARVAVAAFATARVSPDDTVSATSNMLGMGTAETIHWINQQPLWTQDALIRLAAIREAWLPSTFPKSHVSCRSPMPMTQ